CLFPPPNGRRFPPPTTPCAKGKFSSRFSFGLLTRTFAFVSGTTCFPQGGSASRRCTRGLPAPGLPSPSNAATAEGAASFSYSVSKATGQRVLGIVPVTAQA